MDAKDLLHSWRHELLPFLLYSKTGFIDMENREDNKISYKMNSISVKLPFTCRLIFTNIPSLIRWPKSLSSTRQSGDTAEVDIGEVDLDKSRLIRKIRRFTAN